MKKEELYDEICRVLTWYENPQEFPLNDDLENERQIVELMYSALVECQKFLDEAGEEKSWQTHVLFGEGPVNDFYEGVSVDVEDGMLVKHEFATKAEYDAYFKGLDDGDGWNEYATLTKNEYEQILSGEYGTDEGVTDKFGQPIIVGSKVVWYNPDLETRDLNRVYDVVDIIDDETIIISDEMSEVQVFENELRVVG